MMKCLPALSLLSVAFAFPTAAIENHLVYNPQGNAVFQVRFFDVGDGPFMPNDDDTGYESTRNISAEHKAKILAAAQYWAEIIRPPQGYLPAIINVGTFNDENAAGFSDNVSDDSFSLTKLQAVMTGNNPGALTYGSHGQFVLGRLNFDKITYVPSQQPRATDFDLVATVRHELAHGLGITNSVGYFTNEAGTTISPFYEDTFGTWTEHLRDDNGNPAQYEQAILCQGCDNAYDPAAFDVRRDQGYFTGEHVTEVLAGAMRGVPVKILGVDGSIDTDFMSHSELKNSMMSHQNYRNYTTFMEAELALMQDMGYQIDRRNFFGFSVYGNGQTLVNQHGYFQRNAAGTAYLPGTYNTATLGLGLHVYGSNNTIFQQADLLTRGDGGAGVRIDGQGNTLIVNPGTRIYADGLNGRGVLFAYGKDHNFIQRGDIQALGDSGIAVDFNFGHNLLGDETEYRGSWIYDNYEYFLPYRSELEGALADNVDISGRLAGTYAAISISENALVNTINVLNGAQLQGDIYSFYDQKTPDGEQRLTQLTFGRLADAQGRATAQTDPDFRLRYEGNITGINLALTALGGITSLNGTHQIYSMTIAPGATLGGNSEYTLNADQLFVNNGTVSPGNSLGQITVNGDYQQGTSGQLRLEVDGSGGHDTFIVNGNAALAGQLTVVPLRDWYASGWQINSASLIQADTLSGVFNEVNGQLSSPTLQVQVTPQGENGYQFSLLRAENAYSQYGQERNARQAGQALDRIVTNAREDMQPLFRTLDFSAVDGSTVARALNQLSPAGYSAMFASSLNREHQIDDIISADRALDPQVTTDEWRSFAIPFGGGFWQDRQHGSVGYDASSYGVVFGAEKQRTDNLTLGFHGAVSGQSVKVNSPETGEGKTTAFDLGVQARYAPDPLAGAYLFGSGRAGIEDGEMDRTINVDDYRARTNATWTGFSGAVTAGGGYRWALSDNLSAGPLAALNYTALSRRGLNESGDNGSRLTLDSTTFDALRSRVGVSGDWDQSLSSADALKANLQLTWDHELLDTELVQNARFVDYNNSRFNSKNRVVGRDSLGAQAGLYYLMGKEVELGAAIASDLFRSGYDSVSGNLSATWRF
ncbi:autotransporter outer membrane beta-barrel domain-containing protein [Erwinia sp. 9145]|uniref:autotransporter outer membrane beta-barrel domain-containing protein n=1 Tax=Erwinia sp. 9145 TaxID=1500895 RepID=UPI00054D42A7|nr:autotransporter outer membrane beta-barrel domain-containing protein [Erwinia sp. 9145]